MEIYITLLLLLFLIFINVPIAFALIFSSAFYFIASDVPNSTLIQQIKSGVESFPLLAIVFFITAGVLMNSTGITKRLLTFSELLTRRTTGGLAKVNVLFSTLMGGLSGSNIADAATASKILVPEMKKRGYSKSFSTALSAAASLITPIIPPGIGLIIYGYVGNVSIGSLFMAGVIPGIMLASLLLIYTHIVSKKRGYENEKKDFPTFKEVIVGTKDALLALTLPVIIIGGIRLGVFSPTEAGAVAVVYSLFLGLIVYREMKMKELVESLLESAYNTAVIMLIIAGGTAFGWILTSEQIPQKFAEVITENISNPFIFFLILTLFLFIAGMFLEGNVLLIILTPLFMPMLNVYGIDPVHFGIFFVLTLSVGTITPPLGTVMFTTTSITGVSIEGFIKEIWPFWILLFVAILILAFIPTISLWLPNLIE